MLLRKNVLLIGFSASFLFFIGGCAAVQKPHWVEGTSQRYPESRFLIGVGSGDTRSAAESSAYGAIARIFHAQIEQQTREWEQYLQEETGRETTISRSIEIDQVTRVSTEKVLENIKIQEVWTDPQQQRVYALAAMDRAQTAEILTERIDDLDTQATMLRAKASRTDDKIQKVRNLYHAVKALMLRDAHNTDLRIVNPTGKGISPALIFTEVHQEFYLFLQKEFNIAVEVGGPQSEQIRISLLQGLTQYGFFVMPSTGDSTEVATSDIIIKGTVDFQPVPNPEYILVRWTAAFEVSETGSGKVIGKFSKSGREGHINLSEAKKRAVRELQKEVSTELSRRLVEFIFG